MDPVEPPAIITDEKYLLEPLIKELICKRLKPERELIAEIKFLDEFPSYETLFPESNFSPRRVIEYMRDKHASYGFEIKYNPDFYRDITYTYFDHITSEIKSFTFFNNMSLIADIFTICYLYHIQNRSENFTLQIIYDLYDMMKQKYYIKEDDMRHCDDEHAITGLRITQSFPSISFHWFGYEPDDMDNSINSLSHFTFTTFPGINKKLWSLIIASIIPELDGSKFVPIVLLTALFVKAEQIAKDYFEDRINNYTTLSLGTIVERIYALHKSNVFPKSLQLELCMKWDIVKKVGMEYKYADYFNTNIIQAINIIGYYKSQDPDYKNIIHSKIFSEIF